MDTLMRLKRSDNNTLTLYFDLKEFVSTSTFRKFFLDPSFRTDDTVKRKWHRDILNELEKLEKHLGVINEKSNNSLDHFESISKDFRSEMESRYQDFRRMAATLNYVSDLRTWILTKLLRSMSVERNGLKKRPYRSVSMDRECNNQEILTLLKEMFYSDERQKQSGNLEQKEFDTLISLKRFNNDDDSLYSDLKKCISSLLTGKEHPLSAGKDPKIALYNDVCNELEKLEKCLQPIDTNQFFFKTRSNFATTSIEGFKHLKIN